MRWRRREEILRVLRHFEWATAIEVREAAGVPTSGSRGGSAEQRAFSKMLGRLVQGGFVELRVKPRAYRLAKVQP